METLIAFLLQHSAELGAVLIGILIRFLERKKMKAKTLEEKFNYEKKIVELQNKLTERED